MNLVERLLSGIVHKIKRIIVIGDAMVDRWVHGRVEACQDDCPKFVQEKVVEVPGGAANAERSINEWGVNTSLYGYTRADCPIKTRYVEDGKIVFRADNDGPPHRSRDYHWERTISLEMVKHAGAVLLSDYDKGFLLPEYIYEVAKLCAKCGIPCVADCKRAPEVYAGCVLKANSEYQRRWAAAIPFSANVIITNGERNPVAWDGGAANGLGCDLPSVGCVNHVGAGDCFAAHLALALAYGFSLKDAAALAHSAGRVYVQHPHNRPPTPTEVAADLAVAVKG